MEQQDELSVGDSVKVVNLDDEPHLNGLEGIVAARECVTTDGTVDPGHARSPDNTYIVCLGRTIDGDETEVCRRKVKRENLQLLDSSMTTLSTAIMARIPLLVPSAVESGDATGLRAILDLMKVHYSTCSVADYSTDSIGSTPLLRAVQAGKKEVVKVLLEDRYGADVNAPHAPLHPTDKEHDLTPLSLAMMLLRYDGSKEREDIVFLLIEAGADVNKVSKIYGSPLDFIVRCDVGTPKYRMKLLKTLLNKGAVPSCTKTKEGVMRVSPLMYTACVSGSVFGREEDRLEAVQLLLDHEADPGQLEGLPDRKMYLRTTLHEVVSQRLWKVLEALLKSEKGRAAVNKRMLSKDNKSTNGATPIFIAMLDKTLESPKITDARHCITLLLRYGADFHVPIAEGDTPYYVAMLMDTPKAKALLRLVDNAPNPEDKNAVLEYWDLSNPRVQRWVGVGRSTKQRMCGVRNEDLMGTGHSNVTMASESVAPTHGFEDALSLTTIVGDLDALTQPRNFKDRDFFRRVWKQAFGRKAPAAKQVYLVGTREALDEWAPFRDKSYPSFIKVIEYTEDGEERGIPLFRVQDRELFFLLPGDYNCDYLWEGSLTGTNAIIGIRAGRRRPNVYTTREDRSVLLCQGKTAVIGVHFEVRVSTYHPVIFISGKLRLLACAIDSLYFDSYENDKGSRGWESGVIETDDLVKVGHGASLVVEATTMSHSTRSCIKCEGQCVVHLWFSTFGLSGRGDRVQRMSKVTGRHPLILQGIPPAIAVSYAAVIQARECRFAQNYGYPLQFASREEQDGTVGQGLLDMEPKDYVREAFNKRVWIRARRSNSVSASRYLDDLSTDKKRLTLEELAKRRQLISQIPLKRTRGSLEITACCVFEENAMSPLLPDLPEDYHVVVEPWFSSSSSVHELIDADGWTVKRLYSDSESVQDRSAWDIARPQMASERISGVFSPAVTLFRSLCDNEGVLRQVVQYVISVVSESHPHKVFFSQRERQGLSIDSDNTEKVDSSRSERKHNRNQTAYGIMDDAEMNVLRDTVQHNIQRSANGICDAVVDFVDLDNADEYSRICWGRLTTENGSEASLLAAIAGVLALQAKFSLEITPFRAEALVEHLQCDFTATGPLAVTEGFDCRCNLSIECAAYLLGLSNDCVVSALLGLLKDASASDHGRKKAGDVLMRLAFAKPSYRRRVVGALSDCVSEVGNVSQDELSLTSRASFVMNLACLHAKESKDIVREAYMQEKVQVADCGYHRFLWLAGLPIDLDDEVVSDEIHCPTFNLAKLVPDKELQEMAAAFTNRTKKDVVKHNTTLLSKSPCDRCGKKPPRGEDFFVCTRCNNVSYCGTACQRAAWKEHKKVCTPPKADKSAK